MQKRHFLTVVITITPLLFLAACATGPIHMGNMWTNPEMSGGGFSDIFVIGIGQNLDNEVIFERELANVLKANGVAAEPRHKLMGSGEIKDRESVQAAIAGSGTDAVLVTRVLKVEKDREFVPGSIYAVPQYSMGSYYGYYRTSYDIIHDPSYLVEYTTVTLESSLYRVSDETLMWRAQSKTYNPEDIIANIQDLSDQVVQELDRAGLLAKGK